jgi:hypothetical protein
MMKANDLVPRARNFFDESTYFSLNVRNGVIRTPTGTRILGLPEEFIIGLHQGLEEETGAASGIVLYQCGKWWGRQWFKHHAAEVRQFYGRDPGELPLAFFLQVLRRIWALHGWGTLEVSFDLRERGFIDVTLGNAIYSDIVGPIGRPSDHLVAGVLASIIGALSGRDLEGVEISCRSKGDNRCSFLVGLRGRVDVVAEWVKQGRTRAQILDALGKGEI